MWGHEGGIFCYRKAFFPGYSRLKAGVWVHMWESVTFKTYLLLVAFVLQGARSVNADLFCL